MCKNELLKFTITRLESDSVQNTIHPQNLTIQSKFRVVHAIEHQKIKIYDIISLAKITK